MAGPRFLAPGIKVSNIVKRRADKRRHSYSSSFLDTVPASQDYMRENQDLRRENGDLYSVRDMMLRDQASF
jgi:hypothetical protein